MKVIFYNRDFTSQVPLSHLRIYVERYSHTMEGGPNTAYIKIETSGDNWELTKLLRAPVEIYDGDGRLNWWGYVNRVNVPSGDIMVGLGLDNMSNYVAANYSVLDAGSTAATSTAVTAWVSDPASVLEYGQKEKLLSVNNATQAQAESARDTYLASNKYAPPEVELSGGNTKYIRVECYGWFHTLEWKHYANATTSNTATTAQIAAILASAGQFFNGSLIENASGIDSNQYREGTVNALRQVIELMNAGTTNSRPLLARVDKDRYLHIYERQAEDPEYLMRSDGQLETLLGQTVKPSHCISAAWVRIKDIPDALGGLSAMRNFFIESAEYDAERDRTIYRPAGAFEPLRLAKWLGIDPVNVGSGSGGIGGVPSAGSGSLIIPTGGISDYIVLQPSNTALSSGGPQLSTTYEVGTSFDDASASSGYVFIDKPGLFHVEANLIGTLTATAGNSYMQIGAYNIDAGSNDLLIQAFIGERDLNDYFGFDGGFTFPVTTIDNNPYVRINFSGVDNLLTTSYGIVSIVKLASFTT